MPLRFFSGMWTGSPGVRPGAAVEAGGGDRDQARGPVADGAERLGLVDETAGPVVLQEHGHPVLRQPDDAGPAVQAQVRRLRLLQRRRADEPLGKAVAQLAVNPAALA